jgi:hypothetical protein
VIEREINKVTKKERETEKRDKEMKVPRKRER